MPTEYEPLFARRFERDESDLREAQALFATSARPYLQWPWGWVAWAVALPVAALLTPAIGSRLGPVALLFLWSAAILAAGGVESVGLVRRRGGAQREPVGLARWAMRTQGNLSLVGAALSILLLMMDSAWALPALWLLLLGHSLWTLGGLAFPAWRRAGILYQIAGGLALWPGPAAWPVPWPLLVFAVASTAGNLGIAWAVLRRGASGPGP